jgi:hypothetical protein
MKTHRRLIHALAALSPFLAGGTEAQNQERVAREEAAQEQQPAQPSTLVLPARVQLWMTYGTRLAGELLRAEDGRVVVRIDASPPGSERTLPLAEVESAQVSRGRRGHGLKGFLWGAGIGFVAGGWWAGTYCECERADPSFEASDAIQGAIAGAIALGVAGAVIGAFVKTDRWEEIPISSLSAASPSVKADNELATPSPDRQVRFALGPTIDRGVQARFSISWR